LTQSATRLMVMPISTPISKPQSVCDQIESDRIAIEIARYIVHRAIQYHRFIHLLHTMYRPMYTVKAIRCSQAILAMISTSCSCNELPLQRVDRPPRPL